MIVYFRWEFVGFDRKDRFFVFVVVGLVSIKCRLG